MRHGWLGMVALGSLLGARPAEAQEQRLSGAIPQAPGTCSDGQRTGLESDVDCGGPCDPCRVGQACRFARDCTSGRCAEGVCVEKPYRADEPVPAGYEVRASQSDAAATVRTTGLIFFLSSYGAAYVSALSLPSELGALYVPVLGPWFALSHVNRDGAKTLVAIDGALQDAGAILLIGGLLGAGQQLLRQPVPAARVEVTAHVGPRGCGLGVYGAF